MRNRLRHVKSGALVLAVVGGVAAAVWSLRTDGLRAPFATAVTLPNQLVAAAVPSVRPTEDQSSRLAHDRAPDAELLRDAPDRQAVYDAEARPGEFVTPPQVSVEH